MDSYSYLNYFVGDHCIDKPAETEHGKKNLFGCPCRDGYKCVSDVIQEGEVNNK